MSRWRVNTTATARTRVQIHKVSPRAVGRASSRIAAAAIRDGEPCPLGRDCTWRHCKHAGYRGVASRSGCGGLRRTWRDLMYLHTYPRSAVVHAPPAHDDTCVPYTTREAAVMTSLRVWTWHGGTIGGTCRRVAKRGPAARRYDAPAYHWPTAAARGGRRELRRCAPPFLFIPHCSNRAAAHPTSFRRWSHRAMSVPSVTP